MCEGRGPVWGGRGDYSYVLIFENVYRNNTVKTYLIRHCERYLDENEEELDLVKKEHRCQGQ